MSEPLQSHLPSALHGPWPRPDRTTLVAWGVSAVLATAVLFASGGNPLVPVVLAAVGLAGWVVWKAPLAWSTIGLLLVTQVIDDPSASPAIDSWKPFFSSVAELVYENLHKFTGIDALRFSLLDLLVIGLLGLAALRRVLGTVARDQVAPVPSPFIAVVLTTFVALVLLEGWGVARGGDFRNSLWQLRQLLALPLVTLLFAVSLRGPRDFKAMGVVLIAAALYKTGVGLYINETIFRPRNVSPPFVTTHADSMLFALAFVAVVALWYERRTRRTWTLLLLTSPLLLLAMKINNRRLVFVEVAAAVLVCFTLVPWTRFKRFVARAVILSIPLFAVYLAVGWNSTSKIFKPAQMVRSIAQPETDRSTAMRDIENYNLTVTFRSSPIAGVGFGHPYIEQVKADDISKIFPLYRYIPHNSVLALWAFCGMVGFAAIWLPMMTGLFLAVRAYGRSTEPLERAAALTAASMVVIHLIQAWGDMGIQAWSGVFLLGACLASAAQLAVKVGAYPAPQRRALPAAAPGRGAEVA